MNLKNTDIFGRKIFFIEPNTTFIPLSFMENLCTLGYESHIVGHDGGSISERVKKIAGAFPDALIFFNIDASAPEMSWIQFIRQLRQENPDLAVGVVFEATNQDRAHHVEMDYGNDITPSAGCIALSHGKEKENFDTILSALEKSGAKGRRNNIRAKCDEGSTISFKHGSATFHARLDDINILHLCCILDNTESIRSMKIYDKFRDVHLAVNGLEFKSDIVLIMKRVKMGVPTAIFMFIKKPDDEPGLEAELESQLNKKIYEITSKEFSLFLNK